MKQRVAFSGMALAAAVMLAAWLMVAGQPLSAMEQVAAAVREAKSFTFRLVTDKRDPAPNITKVFWIAPGSLRMDDNRDDVRVGYSVEPYGQSGIFVNHDKKTFMRTGSRRYLPPIFMVSRLGELSGNADRELGSRRVDGREVRGFQVALDKVDPDWWGVTPAASDVKAATLDVWVDRATNLPVLIEGSQADPFEPNSKFRMQDFEWNVALDPAVFNAEAPTGYADETPKPLSFPERVEQIVDSFKTYAELFDGHYPHVTVIYGDPQSHQLSEKLGLTAPTSDQADSEAYAKALRASQGFFLIWDILRGNFDAAYHGKTVGPNDKDKVLLRWKLDDGNYRVIYGGLNSETVTAQWLKALEGLGP